ncbi:hypothetical protein COS50_04160, partial [Candidatus Roizmanbacteria bacterium CG03_land_8_20_14_0_80_35_26]
FGGQALLPSVGLANLQGAEKEKGREEKGTKKQRGRKEGLRPSLNHPKDKISGLVVDPILVKVIKS